MAREEFPQVGKLATPRRTLRRLELVPSLRGPSIVALRVLAFRVARYNLVSIHYFQLFPGKSFSKATLGVEASVDPC